MAKPIFADSEIRLFDAIFEEPETVEKFAEKTKIQPQQRYRLLRALTSFGIFYEIDRQKFKSNHFSEILKDETE